VEHRRRTVVSKIDRGYEDFVSNRITEAFWTRKSAEWEAELQTVDAERARLERTHAPTVATAEKILELAKKAENLYKSQNPTEQRRLLETVLSNCTFDRGSLSPTYTSPFDLFVKVNETGNWRREWDSNLTGFFRFCKLQIPRCRRCRERHRCRGALHAVARAAEVCFAFSRSEIGPRARLGGLPRHVKSCFPRIGTGARSAISPKIKDVVFTGDVAWPGWETRSARIAGLGEVDPVALSSVLI
jgi:hypothetical protein